MLAARLEIILAKRLAVHGNPVLRNPHKADAPSEQQFSSAAMFSPDFANGISDGRLGQIA
jgi:hypothetical protein